VPQVFVFLVEDAGALAWRSELAIVAADRSSALRRLRDRGLRKRDLVDLGGRPDRTLSLGEADWLVERHLVWRRRDDDGWTSWNALSATEPLVTHASDTR